ncbi:hypothetical protein V2J09_007068 [Rumex salicifolius]
MGCFKVLKSKKKKAEQSIHMKRVSPQDIAPTVLPVPHIRSHALHSAPPSFCTRTKAHTNALSAPSSVHGANREAFSSAEYDEPRSPTPQPLPLPAPQNAPGLKNMKSFKSPGGSGPLCSSGPLPLPPSRSLRSFTYEEISSACHNFSPDHCTSEGLSSSVYKASILDFSFSSRKLEATVTRFYPSTQGLKEFVNEVNILSTLQHQNLCKLLGYHARDDSEQRILIYERLHHGSLDHLLFWKSDGPAIDWSARMKVAYCAAQGLTFLHEEGPFQAMYNQFSTANIQIDKDFSAKLSGYGCVALLPEADFSNALATSGNLSVETMERGLLTPKSNVYSFGIVLIELLTGRKNMDTRRPKEERNLVKWSWAFLADECRLSLIMDPQLKGRFPMKAARTIADIAQRCLQKDPSERPTMRTITEQLKTVQDIKYSCRFPLQEPGSVIGKQMMKSPSLNGIIVRPQPYRNSLSHSMPLRGQSPSLSPTQHLAILPMSVPLRACSSLLAWDEIDIERRRSSSSSTTMRRASVEGF